MLCSVAVAVAVAVADDDDDDDDKEVKIFVVAVFVVPSFFCVFIDKEVKNPCRHRCSILLLCFCLC